MVEVWVAVTDDVEPALLAAVRRLMDAAFPGPEEGFDEDDWAHTVGGRHVLVTEGRTLLAHAAVIERTLIVGERPFAAGYLEGVATRPDRNGEGLGSLAVAEATAIVRSDFEIGGLGTGRWSFYERLGWERWQGPTYARHPDGPVRTEEDDDGVMVLRFGPSASIDLTAAIACEGRSGDDW